MQHVTLNPANDTLTTARDRLRMQRGAEHLYRLGARGINEFLAELAEDTATAPVILAKLEAWAALDPDMLAAVLHRFCSGRNFPPQLMAVPA